MFRAAVAAVAVLAVQSANAFTWDLWMHEDCTANATVTAVTGCMAVPEHHAAPAGSVSMNLQCANWGNDFVIDYFNQADCKGDVVNTTSNATGACLPSGHQYTCTRNYGPEAGPAAAIVLGCISGVVVLGEFIWFVYFKIDSVRNPERNPFDE